MVSWTQINIIKSDEVGVNPLMSKEKSRVDAKMAVKKKTKKTPKHLTLKEFINGSCHQVQFWSSYDFVFLFHSCRHTHANLAIINSLSSLYPIRVFP